jgi:hypothetical protein
VKPLKIDDMFEDKSKPFLLQVRVDSELHARVQEKLMRLKQSKKITWQSLVEVLFERWLNEK